MSIVPVRILHQLPDDGKHKRIQRAGNRSHIAYFFHDLPNLLLMGLFGQGDVISMVQRTAHGKLIALGTLG